MIDQLFNSSEKRLRLPLLMAHFGKQGVSEMMIPRHSQETLAEMVGTVSASRASFFMNRFRKLGFITTNVGDNLHVHSSLLNIVLHEDNGAVPKGQLEPPREPGEPADKDRAKRPSLSSTRAKKRPMVAKVLHNSI